MRDSGRTTASAWAVAAATLLGITLMAAAVATGHLAARGLPEERQVEIWTSLTAGHPDPDAAAVEHHPPVAVGDWGLVEDLDVPGWMRRLDLGVDGQTDGALVVRGSYEHLTHDGLALEYTEIFGAPDSPFETALGSTRPHLVVDGGLVSLGVEDGFHHLPGPLGGSVACGTASRGPLSGRMLCLIADQNVIGVLTFSEPAAARPREELAAATRDFRAGAASTRHLLAVPAWDSTPV